MANAITGSRILCSAALLFCTVFSKEFYILYIVAGVTDMIDGVIVCAVASVAAVQESRI